jgi:Raf kinase inhibitor-like YbhB/YbcL family protein
MIAATDASRGLAWDLPALAATNRITLRSPDFDDGGPIGVLHAASRVGGQNVSPAITWTATDGATQLLLIVEDPDAPTRTPYLHCIALLDASIVDLDQGALSIPPASGVQLTRSALGPGYFGPAPPKSHGPHRYVFQLFALETPVAEAADLEALPPAELRNRLTRNVRVLARGRLDGTYPS